MHALSALLLQHHQYQDMTFMPTALLLLRIKKADETLRVRFNTMSPHLSHLACHCFCIFGSTFVAGVPGSA